MITRTIPCPAALTASPELVRDYRAEGVRIALSRGQPGQVTITAPDEAAADAAEVWLAQMDAPSD